MAEDKTKEILDRLESGIKEALESEKYKAFLKVQSQFHSYSFNNAMLIYLQRPDATQVAGYRTWQKLGRQVMKGEKGISILAPNPYKYEKLIDKIDPKTREPVRNPETGEIEKVKVEMKGLTFRRVTVFDIKQTDGKELPSICNELQGNSINAENIIKAIKQISDVPIVEKPIEFGAKGYYSRSENLIAIKEGMSLDQTFKTLIHEYAHSQLHSTDAAELLDRATREVQAESVAFIVSDRFGVDTSEYSFEYLANWSSGKELSELKSSFNLIQKTADKIIQEIENVLSKELELQKEKEIEKAPEKTSLEAKTEREGVQDVKEQSVKDKIVELYNKEFPAIKYISESTAKYMDNTNQAQGKIVSVKELKQAYINAGELLESSNNPGDKKVFDALQNVVDDFKQAQLKDMQIKAHDKVIQNQLNKSKTMEMVQ